MGKHKRKPPVFAGNVARQAQTRYLRTKKPESERVQENREAAGHVICLCFMVALNDRYGIGEGRLQRVTDAANGELERFAINQRAVGMERAKKLLNETLAGLYDGNFVLPITKPPKKARDWAMLGEQREAAEIVEIKSKFVRRMQRDYALRRRVFLEQVARPAGWKFMEIITADSKEEIDRWTELTKGAK